MKTYILPLYGIRLPKRTYILIVLLLLCQQTFSQVTRLTVYVFLNTECPISQQYTRRLDEIHQHFHRLGVQFVGVFPLSTDSPSVIKRFCSQYGLSFSGKPDRQVRLAHQFGVRVTPEVVVVNAANRVVYQGAIDDWYISLGRHQREATHPYLEDALNAVLDNRPILQARTDAVGCLIE